MKQLNLRKYLLRLIKSLIKHKPHYTVKIVRKYNKDRVKVSAKVIRRNKLIYKQVFITRYDDEDITCNYLILLIAFNVFRISKSLFQRKFREIYDA